MMRRLRSLSSHLRPDDGPPQRANASGAPPPDVLRGAVDRKFSDAQMKQFLTQGYMVIPIKDVEPDFHETIYQKAKTLYRAEDGRYRGQPLPFDLRSLGWTIRNEHNVARFQNLPAMLAPKFVKLQKRPREGIP